MRTVLPNPDHACIPVLFPDYQCGLHRAIPVVSGGLAALPLQGLLLCHPTAVGTQSSALAKQVDAALGDPPRFLRVPCVVLGKQQPHLRERLWLESALPLVTRLGINKLCSQDRKSVV